MPGKMGLDIIDLFPFVGNFLQEAHFRHGSCMSCRLHYMFHDFLCACTYGTLHQGLCGPPAGLP